MAADDMRPEWATRLRQERRARGWALPEMARQLRVAASPGVRAHLPGPDSLVRAIRRWEAGEHFPDEQHRLLYARAFSTTEEDLFSRVAWCQHDESSDVLTIAVSQRRSMPRLAHELDMLCGVDLTTKVRDPRFGHEGLATSEDLDSLVRAALEEPSPIPVGDEAGRRVDYQHVEQIKMAARVFRFWDNQFGGGLRRKAVIGQLDEVTGLLAGPFANERVGRHLLSAVADLAQLAGWMSFDMGLHGLAQRYFAFGLHLAREAGDRLQIARMLYCLARQMIDLEKAADALELVQTALYGIRRVSTPRTKALLLVMEARTHAKCSNSRECDRALRLAHEIFSDAHSDSEPGWLSFFDDAELAGLSGVALRDLALRDADHEQPHALATRPYLMRAVENRSANYLRSHILDLDALATVDLLLGEPERAAGVMTRAFGLAGHVVSPRVARNLDRTVSLARNRYKGMDVIEELHERARAMIGK